MFGEHSSYDWRQALDACVERILAKARMSAPPVDALQLATTLGFVVATDVRQQPRARCARLHGPEVDETAAIMLRPEPRVERRQWAVAHEIGEQHAHEVFAELGESHENPSQGDRERVANELANRLLMPTEWFLQDGRECNWDLAMLKRRYSTASYELIARRTLDADIPAILTLYDQGRLRFRCTNSGAVSLNISPVERAVWMCAHLTGRIQRRNEPTYLVRAWPIHETGWKREILRTDQLSEGNE